MGALHQYMTVAVGGAGQAAVVVAGEVDASNADQLHQAILEADRNGQAKLEIDLAGVTFMDSSGLKAIADAALGLEPSGLGVVLCHVPRQVLRILQLVDVGVPLEVRP